jgi:hypothetical protein
MKLNLSRVKERLGHGGCSAKVAQLVLEMLGTKNGTA